jgi:hypothetical protein
VKLCRGFIRAETGCAVASLAEVYEEQAVGCVQAAAKTDDPHYREMLLKMAREWRMEAAALRRASTQSTLLRTEHRAR